MVDISKSDLWKALKEKDATDGIEYNSSTKEDLSAILERVNTPVEENVTPVVPELVKKDDEDNTLLMDRLLRQVETLTLALNAERDAKDRIRDAARGEVNEELYTVENVLGSSLWIKVHDHRGVPIEKNLAGKGAKVDLTASQIAELRNDRPDYFAKGYLSAPDVVPSSANTITDYEAFFARSYDEVKRDIERITSLDVIRSIHDYLEAKRWATHDEEGTPLVKKFEGRDVPDIREVELSGVEAASLGLLKTKLNVKVGYEPVDG